MWKYFLIFFPLNKQILFFEFKILFKEFSLIFKLNLITLIFLIGLIFIYNQIHTFLKIYMEKSMNLFFFSFTMKSFLLSMIFLIFSKDSWLLVILSWEGLGLTSFILVLFYNNWNSLQGSSITLMINRFGDSFMVLSIFIFLKNFFFLSFILMIFFMSFSKSAIFPFSSWLPAAMAAPTPVSALVHSSTLVTAGIFLFFQFNFPKLMSSMKFYMIIFGSITMMMGSMLALISFDLKKMVAFSTLSQLGMMLITFNSLMWGLPIFHLLTHAFMKSMMFIIVGFFILSTKSQAIVSSSMSLNKISLFSMIILIILNFISMFFTSMFITKEMIILNIVLFKILSLLFYFFMFSLTIFYSIRFMKIMLFNLSNLKIIMKKNQMFFFSKFFYFLFFNLMYFMIVNNFYFEFNLLNLKICFMFFLSSMLWTNYFSMIFLNILNWIFNILSKLIFFLKEMIFDNFMTFFFFKLFFF